MAQLTFEQFTEVGQKMLPHLSGLAGELKTAGFRTAMITVGQDGYASITVLADGVHYSVCTTKDFMDVIASDCSGDKLDIAKVSGGAKVLIA